MYKRLLFLLALSSVLFTSCYTQIADGTPDDLIVTSQDEYQYVPGIGDKVNLERGTENFSGNFVGADTSVYADSSGDVVVINNYYERLKYIESLGYDIPESKMVLAGYFPPTTVYVSPNYPTWSFSFGVGWANNWCGYWDPWYNWYPRYYGYYEFDYYNWGGYGYWGGNPGWQAPIYKYRHYNGVARNRGRSYIGRGRTSNGRYADNNNNRSTVKGGSSSRSSGVDLDQIRRASRNGTDRKIADRSRAASNRVASSRGHAIDSETLKRIRSNPKYRNNIKSNSREARLVNARNRDLAKIESKRSKTSGRSNLRNYTNSRYTKTPKSLSRKTVRNNSSPNTYYRSSSNSNSSSKLNGSRSSKRSSSYSTSSSNRSWSSSSNRSSSSRSYSSSRSSRGSSRSSSAGRSSSRGSGRRR